MIATICYKKKSGQRIFCMRQPLFCYGTKGLARRLQCQARMLAQRMEVDLGKALLRQTHVVGAGAQVGQGVGRVLSHAHGVGVHKLLQFFRRVGRDPAGAGVLAALQANVAVVFGFHTVLHHLELQLTDRAINLVEDAYDLGIRFGELPDTRLGARKILSNHRYLCAAPAYLKRNGTPRTPQDLAQHRCILHRQNDDTYSTWKLQKGRKHESVKVHGSLSSNDGDVVLGWALDGHGILMRAEWDIERYLQSGRLVQVLPNFKTPDADIYAVYPQRHQLSARIRTFVDYLSDSFSRFK